MLWVQVSSFNPPMSFWEHYISTSSCALECCSWQNGHDTTLQRHALAKWSSRSCLGKKTPQLRLGHWRRLCAQFSWCLWNKNKNKHGDEVFHQLQKEVDFSPNPSPKSAFYIDKTSTLWILKTYKQIRHERLWVTVQNYWDPQTSTFLSSPVHEQPGQGHCTA